VIDAKARLGIEERSRVLDVCKSHAGRALSASEVNPRFRQALIVANFERDRAASAATLWLAVAEHYSFTSDFLRDLDVLLVACVIERTKAVTVCFRITEYWTTHTALCQWDADIDEDSEVWLAAATALRAGHEDAARDIVERGAA
jgi:hypothetical protein